MKLTSAMAERADLLGVAWGRSAVGRQETRGLRVRARSGWGAAIVAVVLGGCASVPRHVPASQDVWDRIVCFADVVPDTHERESSGLEGSVFTAGYGSSEFPVPVAVVYARRAPDGK